MNTFDDILPATAKVLSEHPDVVNRLAWLRINRDLSGRVRLIAPVDIQQDPQRRAELEQVYGCLAKALGRHAYPAEEGLLYESSPEKANFGSLAFPLAGFENVRVLDRTATEIGWEKVRDDSPGAPRFVFFSIKGGVGRSTALATSAWSLARKGKRVLVLDLDLESPGLSSALLPLDRQPKYGITDWLVEDLVDNGDALIEDLYSTSGLPTAGSIHLVPAHGRDPGEYVAKMGRIWMPKVGKVDPADSEIAREDWASRLNRLVGQLEAKLGPEVLLIDSRAGIDEVAAACISELGAQTIFLFAVQGQQTWTGYRSLFRHWQQREAIRDIRKRLQVVASLVPDDDRRLDYLAELRQGAYELFEDTYDEVGPGEIGDWSFEQDDDVAPHAPLPIRWNRGWYGLLSLHQRLVQVDEMEVTAVYGALQDFLDRALNRESV